MPLCKTKDNSGPNPFSSWMHLSSEMILMCIPQKKTLTGQLANILLLYKNMKQKLLITALGITNNNSIVKDTPLGSMV